MNPLFDKILTPYKPEKKVIHIPVRFVDDEEKEAEFRAFVAAEMAYAHEVEMFGDDEDGEHGSGDVNNEERPF